MLSLHVPTADRWFAQVDEGLEEILIDHAHCEKKAAGVAMNLLFAYVDNTNLARAMTEIVNEELEHFQLVLDLLERRGIPFRKLAPSHYGPRLHELIRKGEPDRAVDRLLVAGLIEARSCERFSLLKDHVQDEELAAFYGGLFESEAGTMPPMCGWPANWPPRPPFATGCTVWPRGKLRSSLREIRDRGCTADCHRSSQT